MSATSARGAAMKILLEDFEPLLARMEGLSGTLEEVRGEINADLTMLGILVQRTVDVQPGILDTAKKLNGAAARIEEALNKAPARAAVPKGGAAANVWVACLASAVLAALLVGGGFYVMGRDVLEQARIGKALQGAWSTMDPQTREKIQGAIGR